MATSSITANFRIEDAVTARAFVDALCANFCKVPNLPNVMESNFETRTEERDFPLRGPYGRKAVSSRVRRARVKRAVIP